MTGGFNDNPIDTASEDRYASGPFAASIAATIRQIERPVGTAIALSGSWGSGKSSVINLTKEILEADDAGIIVTDFKCWWYKGEEALALAFFQALDSVLRRGLGDRIKGLVPTLAQRVLQAGPVIGSTVSLLSGSPWVSLIPGASQFVSTFFSKKVDVEQLYHKLFSALANQNQRFLIIIDDIDRLSLDEYLAIFRVIKSVGRLPNVIYLLSFDRNLVESAIMDRYPSEGPSFIEKIVQVVFDIPEPLQSDLNNAVLSDIHQVCGSPIEDKIVRFMNVFYDAVVPYIETPRHAVRLRSSLTAAWPAIRDEIDIADFVAMEAIRLHEPSLWRSIRQNRDLVCGLRTSSSTASDMERRFEPFLISTPQHRHEQIKTILQRLFPKLEQSGYTGSWLEQWDAERRICIDKHFQTYFRLSLSEESLSTAKIEDLLVHAADRQFLQATFREAASQRRRNGKSLVPMYLDELMNHSKKIRGEDIRLIIINLIEIYDEINLKSDDENSFDGFGNTNWRYYWLIQRLVNNLTLTERDAIFIDTRPIAPLGWLVDFAVTTIRQYEKESGSERTSPDELLIEESSLNYFKSAALDSIRSAATDDTLIFHNDIGYILFCWKFLSDGNATEARAWTDQKLAEDCSVIIFAKTFTGRSHSAGLGWFGGLGDRVSKVNYTCKLDVDSDYIDAPRLVERIESIQSGGTLSEEDFAIASSFLVAWREKRSGAR